MIGDRAGRFAVAGHEIDNAQIAGFADGGVTRHLRAQSFRHRRPGIDEIDIDAARPVVAGRHCRGDVAILARPADAPRVHLADAVGRVFAQKPRQIFVAQSAAGGERVVQVMLPIVRRFFAKRRRHRHLRHHGGAAAADQAAVGEQHFCAAARSLDRRIHAGGAGADHQHVGVDVHGFRSHYVTLGVIIRGGE